MILAVEVDVNTGKRYDEHILCEECFEAIDHNYACNCPERFLCVVKPNVEGECSECNIDTQEEFARNYLGQN